MERITGPDFDAHNLAPNQEIAIAALVAGASLRDAAKKARVNERTLRRWRKEDPYFEASLRRSIEAIRREINLQLVQASQVALNTLTAMAADPNHPQALQASRHILSMARITAPLNPRTTLLEVVDDMLNDQL